LETTKSPQEQGLKPVRKLFPMVTLPVFFFKLSKKFTVFGFM
jgi:hypothetical protein